MHCTYWGWQKDTSRDEVMLYSEKTEPVALSIVELCLAEGTSQSVSWLIENSEIFNIS